MSEKLKPCPFCGGKADVERMGTHRASMIISCTNCGCSLESGETSLEKCNWNDRQPCKELTEKLKRFSDSGYDIHLKLKCTDGVFRSIRDIEEAKCQ